jgi:hypothetical protein
MHSIKQKKRHLHQHKVFKITVFVQSMICLLSQQSVFAEASSLLKKMFFLDISAKQFQNVSEYYGNQLDPIINANQTDYIPQLSERKSSEQTDTYVMMDGSMVFTREEKWKENKLARIFNSDKNITVNKDRNEIVENVYVSHLGGIDTFLPKLERHISLVKNRKIFISDGAKWIWNWVEDNYPGATQIIDYYHAIEKIEHLAKVNYTSEEKRKTWVEEQKELLMNDGVYEVITNITNLKPRTELAKEAKQLALRYYTEHEDRMLYKTFKDKGLLIGSGPIESAHRNVIQKRMKLSGQKWSKKGANAIANLRCYQLSNSWSMIESLIKIAA